MHHHGGDAGINGIRGDMMGQTVIGIHPDTDYFWVWCDVDGNGNRWNLCTRGEEDGEETLIFLNQLDDSLIPYFDFSSHYADYPALTILTPKSPSEDW